MKALEAQDGLLNAFYFPRTCQFAEELDDIFGVILVVQVGYFEARDDVEVLWEDLDRSLVEALV